MYDNNYYYYYIIFWISLFFVLSQIDAVQVVWRRDQRHPWRAQLSLQRRIDPDRERIDKDAGRFYNHYGEETADIFLGSFLFSRNPNRYTQAPAGVQNQWISMYVLHDNGIIYIRVMFFLWIFFTQGFSVHIWLIYDN